MRKAVAGLAACLSLAGCSVTKDVPAAESAIGKFHQQLNAGSFDAVYAEAGAEMKGVDNPAASFNRFLSAIHRKLGAFQTGSSTSWKDNVTTTGHYVTIDYAARYERGAADENFVFRFEGSRAILAGYHINSTALIIN